MAIALKPDHAGAHFNAGDILLSQGKYTEAAKWFQKSSEGGYKYAAGVLGCMYLVVGIGLV